jgi:hypothetical protein
VLAERAPQPRGLDQQLQADLALELGVAGGVEVADDGVGDVGVDVEGGGAGGPVAEHSSPWIVRQGKAAPARPSSAAWSRAAAGSVPPAQRVGGGVRVRVGQHRQDEGLGVPERVPVVAGAGQALGRDRPLLGAGAGLQDVEQAER